MIRTRTRLPGLPFLAGAFLLVLPPGPSSADDKGPVTVKKVKFGGWENNLSISNDDVELIVTLDVGPRIISYQLKKGDDKKNVFKEYEDQLGKSGEKTWQIRGGHRLWVAPEDPDATYAIDNAPITYQVQEGTGAVRLAQKADSAGFKKEMEIRLDPKGSGVTVEHRITRTGKGEAVEVAPWALTVMAPGGIEVIPLPAKSPHPGSKAKKASDFWPNQNLVTWPYFDFTDSRYTFGKKYIVLEQRKRGPTKIGMMNEEGWAAYANRQTLFVKRISVDKGEYPDRGSNYETFTNEDMLEMETLGPLVKLAPGESTVLLERWALHPFDHTLKEEKDIDRHVLPLVRAK